MPHIHVELVGTVIDEFIVYDTVRVPNDDGSYSRFLPVECPRSDCGEEFLVHLTWKKLRRSTRADGSVDIFTTRSCPYCFRVSMVPIIFWPDWVLEKYNSASKQAREYYKARLSRREIKAKL